MLDEIDPLTLVGRRKTPATSAAHQPCPVDADGVGPARLEHHPAFQCRDSFAAQQTGQLNPLRSPNARTSLNELCRHVSATVARDSGRLQSGITPICNPDLGTASNHPYALEYAYTGRCFHKHGKDPARP